MKTNVSIKFNSIEEYREIEKKLIEMGYRTSYFNDNDIAKCLVIYIDYYNYFDPCNFFLDEKVYNSLEEFLKD